VDREVIVNKAETTADPIRVISTPAMTPRILARLRGSLATSVRICRMR
jgi:hypothetical protein